MRKATPRLLLIFGVLAFGVIPLAHADDFGFYAVGTFQFDSTTISGYAGGICSGQCVPWGNLVVLNAAFSASVTNYQENASCSNDQCETEISGDFGGSSLSAHLAVGDPPQFYYLGPASLRGSFDTHFCIGNCRTYRPETELSLAYDGPWNNGWFSSGTIQLECFQQDGCSAGSGAGDLDTFTPEPPSLALLGSGLAWLGRVVRRKLPR